MIQNVDWMYFGTLTIQPGDTLFIRSPTPPEEKDVERLQAMFSHEVTIVFVALDVDISKWTEDRILSIPVEAT